MLRKDKEEVEAIKHAKALEAEKAMYSVRWRPVTDFNNSNYNNIIKIKHA